MNLSEKRIDRGLQQKDMMKDISLYSKIENGKAIAVEEDCERFAQIFECDMQELFEEKELLFFRKLVSLENGVSDSDKEFADKDPKIVSAPICKPQKKHFDQLRKCYWLGKTRNAELKRVIESEGFRTEQEWFSFMVDQEIEKALRPDKAETEGI